MKYETVTAMATCGWVRRWTRCLGAGLIATTLAATVAAQGAKTAVPCAQGLVVPGGGGPAGRFTLCSEVEQQVPQLRQLLEKLVGDQGQQQRDIERLLRNVNTAAMRIEAKQIEMARSLSKQLAAAIEQPGAGAMRRIRRISDGLEEINEKTASTAANQPEAAAALKVAIDEAVIAFDFGKANKLLDSIESLQRQLTGVEKKIDIVVETADDSRNTTVLAEAVRSRSRGDLGQVRVLGVFVQQGKTFDGQDFSGVGFSGAKATGMRAPGANLTLTTFTNAELSKADFTEADMIAIMLEGANLVQARLRLARAALAQAHKANLQGADLSLSTWIAADLRGADLREANLKGANFAHADLSNTDLRGADLSGAFFENADLRGAKFDDAIFANTDVAGALLPRNLLSAVQLAGLCATSPETSGRWPSGNWTIVERIPTSRFQGGYEYRRIYEQELYVGRGGHRPYARCQLRRKGTIADWNGPVLGVYDGVEARQQDFAFQVEHPLMDAPGRRAELLKRIRSAYTLAKERPKSLQAMPQFAEVARRLYAALEQRQRQLTTKLAPAGPLLFDGDTGALIAMRLRPSLFDELGFDWLEASKGGFGDVAGKTRGHPTPWPKLYPENLTLDDLSEVTARAWQSWVRARSKSLRDNEVRIQVSRDILSAGTSWSRVLVYNSRSSSEEPMLANKLGVEPVRLATFRAIPTLDGIKRLVGSAFLVEGDVEAVRTALKAALSPPDGELILPAVVKDVRLVPADGGELLLWTLEIPSP